MKEFWVSLNGFLKLIWLWFLW